jgi:HlyD family secretion protein
VRLSTDDLEKRLQQAELDVVQARNELASAQAAEKIQQSENTSTLSAAESKLRLAELALKQWQEGDAVQTRQKNLLAVEKAAKNLERLREKFAQSELLFSKDFLSKDERDRDEIALIEAEAAMKEALLTQEVYEQFQYRKDEEQFTQDVAQARSELERVTEQNEINLRTKQAQTEARTQQMALQETNLADIRTQLAACEIRAPREGLVVYASSTGDGWRWQNEGGLRVGSEVGPNDLIALLPDTTNMLASVKVHESLAGRIRPGQKASVRIDALGQVVPGSVESVGVLAESGGWRDPNRREYTVKIALDLAAVQRSDSEYAAQAGAAQAGGGQAQGAAPATAKAGEIRPTMRAEATITLGEVTDALAVPVQAVFADGPVRYVYTPAAGGKLARLPVSVGRMSETHAEVLAGVEAGTAVLLRSPAATEVDAQPFTEAALVAAGYVVDEEGNARPAPRGRPGARPNAGAVPAGAPGAVGATVPDGATGGAPVAKAG